MAEIISLADYRAPVAVPQRGKGRGAHRGQPLPKAPPELTPLDILNRIAVKLGLPALNEDGGAH